MLLKDYLKEDKICIPVMEDVKRKLIPTEIQRKFAALKKLDESTTEQISLGLGVPRADLHPIIEKMRKDTYAYSKSRLLKAGFKMVEEPPERYFPRFENGKVTSLKKVPLLAMAKLQANMSTIRLRVGNNSYSAPLPRFPKAAMDAASKVKSEAPNAEFHLLYMPSWSKEPQRDPVLLAKVKGKFFSVYEWGDDLDVIKEFLDKS